MKTCTKCLIEKDLGLFGRDKHKKSGYTSHCLVCMKSTSQARRDANPEKAREIAKAYRMRNPEKEKARYTKYNKDNPEVRAHHASMRRASELQATPAWLTEEHKEGIKSMFVLAKKFEKLCNTSYHVDHIVPLAGKDVCGLHVPWNLQLLPASVNMSKGNRHHEEALTG